jgi:hypothetical protein
MNTRGVLAGWACATALLTGAALFACAANGTGSISLDASDETAFDAAEEGASFDAPADAGATDARATDARPDQAPPGSDASTGLDASEEPYSNWDGSCVWPDATVGLPPDPGFISCGNEDHPLSAGGACCEGFTGDLPAWWFYYWSPSGACSGSDNPYIDVSLRRSCDEPADCPAGTVCCINDTAYYGSLDYSCEAVCPPPTNVTFNGDAGIFGFEACKSADDCQGEPCVVQYCSWAENQTRQTQTCGGIPPSESSSSTLLSCSQPLANDHVCGPDGGVLTFDSGSTAPDGSSATIEGGSSVEGGAEGGSAQPEAGGAQ